MCAIVALFVSRLDNAKKRMLSVIDFEKKDVFLMFGVDIIKESWNENEKC